MPIHPSENCMSRILPKNKKILVVSIHFTKHQHRYQEISSVRMSRPRLRTLLVLQHAAVTLHYVGAHTCSPAQCTQARALQNGPAIFRMAQPHSFKTHNFITTIVVVVEPLNDRDLTPPTQNKQFTTLDFDHGYWIEQFIQRCEVISQRFVEPVTSDEIVEQSNDPVKEFKTLIAKPHFWKHTISLSKHFFPFAAMEVNVYKHPHNSIYISFGQHLCL